MSELPYFYGFPAPQKLRPTDKKGKSDLESASKKESIKKHRKNGFN